MENKCKYFIKLGELDMKMKFFLCSYLSFCLCGYLGYEIIFSCLPCVTKISDVYLLLPLFFCDIITVTFVSAHYIKNNIDKRYTTIKLLLINISGFVVSLVAFNFSMIVSWCIGMSGMWHYWNTIKSGK